MTTLADARRAKQKVKQLIGHPSWLRGIGLGLDAAGRHAVRVNVAAVTQDVEAAIPGTVDGVTVLVETVGAADALVTTHE